MPAPIKCFLIEGTARAQQFLRRYTSYKEGSCPVNGWGHEAKVRIEDGELVVNEDGTFKGGTTDEHPRSDPRWPTHCECGYEFTDEDTRQLFYERIYLRADNGAETTLRDAPAGAMWYADWMCSGRVYKEPGHFIGPDGHCLMVQLPDGHEWCVDGPASNGPGWERTGTVPNITARPSIGRQDKQGGWLYHGWLTNGELTDA